MAWPMPWPCWGPQLQGPEDKHVERALEELQAPFVGLFRHSRRQSQP